MRSFTTARLALSILLGSLAACAAPAGAPGASSEADVHGGEADARHPAVGMVFMKDGNVCSGTLIAPDVVLTAAHCVVGEVDSFLTGPGAAVDAKEKLKTPPANTVRHPVVATAMTPDYAATKDAFPEGIPCPNIAGRDVGLVLLAEPIADVEPVAFSTKELPAPDDTCSVVGYGLSLDQGRLTLGEKRSAEVRVVALESSEDFDNPRAVSIQIGFGTGMADGGDSGGPLLCAGRIVAVTSCGLARNAEIVESAPDETFAYYASVPAAAAWIRCTTDRLRGTAKADCDAL